MTFKQRQKQAIKHRNEGAAMTTKHTPGPWTVQWSVDDFGNDTNDITAPGTTVASDVQSYEDARLIAAAPDLLAALADIISWGEQATGHSMDAGNARECARIARAAIAKAQGE